MAYETSKFGDGGYVAAGGTSNVTQDVSNFYGPRDLDWNVTQGVIKTEGGMNELTIHITGQTVNAGELALTVRPFMPARSRVEAAYLEVSEAFDVEDDGGEGTGVVVSVGTEESEATNGVDASEAQLSAVGVYDITSTLAGTWAAAGGLTARTVVNLSVGGTAPEVTDPTVGKAKVVIRYIHV